MRTRSLHDAVRRQPSDDWQSVLLEEHRLVNARVARPVEEVAPPPEEKQAQRPRRKGDPLRSHAEYVEVLTAVLDARRLELAERIGEDAFFTQAPREWRMDLGWTGPNAPLFREAMSRVSMHMKAAFGFEPAWLGEARKPFQKNCLAYYVSREDLVYLSPDVLGEHLPELVATIVHEQVHAYQWRVIDQLQSWQLQDPEMRAIATYWLETERSRQWAYGEAYMNLGTEYHAYRVDQLVFWTVWFRAFPDLWPM